MTRSPATPQKSNKTFFNEASKVAVPYLDKLTSNAKGKQTSPEGPSPASTYGDTAAGDSVPVTPLVASDHVFLPSMRAAQTQDSDEPTVESPVSSRQAKRSPQPDLVADTIHVTFANKSPSTSKTRSVGTTAIVSLSADSSPSGGATRYQNILGSPSWRRQSFVRQRDQAEDPFTTADIAPKSAGRKGGDRFLPREDRANLELTGDTAQALLTPNACVFVANLSSARTDDQLEHSVTRAFEVFGNCYVKIRRDNQSMPFAFCQYEDPAHAQNAIDQGRGITIDGRPCRTERAKVNRSLYLSEVSGRPISETEALRLLLPYGAIEKIWYSSPTDKEMYHLPDGIWVTYAYFQDCRDAHAAFREEGRWHLEQPVLPSEYRRRANRSVHAGWSGVSPSPPSRLHQRARDGCIIYVGNLPPQVTRDRLEALFAPYGSIRDCELVSKGSANTQCVSVFAFIEFASESQARAAATREHALDGVRLRVEPKDSVERRVSPAVSSGSPHANVGGYGQNDPRNLLYDYAISLGFDLATAAPILMLGQGTPMTPPMYSPYSYYGNPFGYGHPYGTTANGTSGSPGMQGNAQDMTQQAMGHFQYPQGQVPYHHYQQYPYTYQQHSMINSTGPAADTTGSANGTDGAQ